MILYFTDRELKIIGKASTSLPQGHMILNDKKVEDIETMTVSFECDIPYEDSSKKEVESCTMPGNYVLRKCDEDADVLFQIIESENGNDAYHIYCEDIGMELLNEVALAMATGKEWTITEAVQNTIVGSGYEIGINQLESTEKKLCEFSEQTRSERLKEIAELFSVELDYRFELDSDGHKVQHKYIDIYKKRGSNRGVTLRNGEDIEEITITRSIENLATSLYVYGDANASGVAVTLEGYRYDDGDYVVAAQEFDDRTGDGKSNKGYCLQSRNALKKWGRMVNGSRRHITKVHHVSTVDQKTMFDSALQELQKISDIAVNYECDISRTEKEIALGDTANVVDERGGLYLESRVLKIETSIVDKTRTLTLGDYLIQDSGISNETRENIAQIVASAIGSRVQEMTADHVRKICV